MVLFIATFLEKQQKKKKIMILDNIFNKGKFTTGFH